jgi:TatD DNase family protein
LDDVLQRAFDGGLEKIIVTGGNLEQSRKALELAKSHERLFSTVGVHPTNCSEFHETPNLDPEQFLEELLTLATTNRGKIVAIGECGLDFDRLQFCPKDVQLKYFAMQLELSRKAELPLFLHCRNAFPDFIDILQKNRDSVVGGVMHSFDGALEEALAAIEFGLYIGINGW